MQMKNNETASYSLMGSAFINGLKAMMPACFDSYFCMVIISS